MIDLTEPPARACLRSGYCCKKAPCPFGRRDPASGWCVHLVQDGDVGGTPTYACARYDEIRAMPPGAGAEMSPAFGAGCCSPLGNVARGALARALGVR